MPIPEKPRAFSNIRRPGHEYTPEIIPGWTGPPQVSEEDQDLILYGKSLTQDARNQFEQHVFNEIGGNPAELNPREALSVVDENLPELFENFFGGRVVWEDRGKLTKEQGESWDEVVRSYHATVLKEAEVKKAMMIDKHNFMMNRWDNEVAERKVARDKILARREKIAELVQKRKEKETEAALKEPTPEDIKRASDMLGNIEKTMGKGTLPSQAQLDMYNMLARRVGAPEVELVENELDLNVLQKAWDFWGGKVEKTEVELKKKPPIKPKPVTGEREKSGTGHKLDRNNTADVALAKRFLRQAGGNAQKARQLARERGYSF